MKNADEAAFPEPFVNDPHLAISHRKGLTKREHFAGLALQGLIAHDAQGYLERNPDRWELIIAETSVSLADALLKKLKTK